METVHAIKLDKQTVDFYRQIALSRKLNDWYEMYKERWCSMHGYTTDFIEEHDEDDECFACIEEFFSNELVDKEIMKDYLTYNEYEVYLKLYDDIFTEE